MLNEMRDFYKALCRTVTGTKFKLIRNAQLSYAAVMTSIPMATLYTLK